ncbi:MAG: hypothetical protein PHU27_05575 [Salinivirgaceae bacterium]|nr:hypothetical protein [Salinivirgaceae bacterium]MDD4748185.1 hypothetical protein [Salinivirgaceae bacterium]
MRNKIKRNSILAFVSLIVLCTACKDKETYSCNIRFADTELDFNRVSYTFIGEYITNIYKHEYVFLGNDFSSVNGKLSGEGSLLTLTILTNSRGIPLGEFLFIPQEVAPSLFSGSVIMSYNTVTDSINGYEPLTGGKLTINGDPSKLSFDINLETNSGKLITGSFWGPMITETMPKFNK